MWLGDGGRVPPPLLRQGNDHDRKRLNFLGNGSVRVYATERGTQATTRPFVRFTRLEYVRLGKSGCRAIPISCRSRQHDREDRLTDQFRRFRVAETNTWPQPARHLQSCASTERWPSASTSRSSPPRWIFSADRPFRRRACSAPGGANPTSPPGPGPAN